MQTYDYVLSNALHTLGNNTLGNWPKLWCTTLVNLVSPLSRYPAPHCSADGYKTMHGRAKKNYANIHITTRLNLSVSVWRTWRL